MTLVRNASGVKAEQLSAEDQCVLGIDGKAQMLRERLSTFGTSARLKVSKGGKSPASRSRLENAYNGVEL